MHAFLLSLPRDSKGHGFGLAVSWDFQSLSGWFSPHWSPVLEPTLRRKRRYNNYRKVKTGLPERYYDYDFQFNKVSELKVGDYVKTPIPYRCEMDMNEYKETDIWI